MERSVRHRVLLDETLAALYGVEVKALNQAVARNVDRFPGDFMFQLSPEEANVLRSQTVTSSVAHGGRRYLPRSFAEQGVAMLSTELALKLAKLERKYDAQFKVVFDAIRELMTPPANAKKRIGFRADGA